MTTGVPRARGVVGVREFRARLSAYLRAAAAGAIITVGDRWRRPLARLVPVARSPDDEVLDWLVAEGVLQRGQGKTRLGSAREATP